MAAASQAAPNFEFTQIEGSQQAHNESEESESSDSEVEEPLPIPREAIAPQGEVNPVVMGNDEVIVQPETADLAEEEAMEEQGAAQSTVTFSPEALVVKVRSPKTDMVEDGEPQPTREESHNISDVSTLLDTTKGSEDHRAEDSGEEDDGGGWINANVVQHPSAGKKYKDLEKKRALKYAEGRERRGVGKLKENEANHSGADPDVVEIEAKADEGLTNSIVDEIDQSDEQTKLMNQRDALMEEKRQLEEQLAAIVVPAVREAIQGMLTAKDKEVRKVDKILQRFVVDDWVQCNGCQKWYKVRANSHPAGESWFCGSESCNAEGTGDKKETVESGLSKPERNEKEEDKEDEDEEELEEPMGESSAERLIRAVYEQANEEPSTSQVLASDVLLSMVKPNAKGNHEEGKKEGTSTSSSSSASSIKGGKVSFKPATSASRGDDEEAELEFQQSQEDSPDRLLRLRKVGSSSEKQKTARRNVVNVEEEEDRDKEEEEDHEEEEGPALSAHQIPLSLLRDIQDRAVASESLHSGEWKSRIGRELIAAGWEWRVCSGLETGWRLLRPGVGKRDAKDLLHYTHYIMDEEVAFYVGISIDHPRYSHARHQECFFDLLNEQAKKPRSRRGIKLPMNEVMMMEPVAPKPITSSSSHSGGKKGKGKRGADSPTLAKKRKARPSSPEHGERGGGGKRFVKTNVRHNDYIEVDTQYLDDMEIDDDDGFEMTQAQATVSSPSSVGSRSGGSKTPQQQAAEAKSRPTERERAPYVQVSSPPANNSIARQSSLMNMNSGGSLMFIGRQFCFSGVEKEQQARFEDAVQRHAGKIISTIDALREKLRSLKEEREAEEDPGSQREGDNRIIIFSHPHMYRREKFLMGLACPRDTLMLHPQWLVDCIKNNKQVDFSPYLLPTGSSLVRPFAHLPPDSLDLRPRVLQKSLRVADLSAKSPLDWGAIVELAGATLVEPTQQQLDRIAAGDTAVDGIDIAIADPDRSKWGLELTKRQEVPFVKVCSKGTRVGQRIVVRGACSTRV